MTYWIEVFFAETLGYSIMQVQGRGTVVQSTPPTPSSGHLCIVLCCNIHTPGDPHEQELIEHLLDSIDKISSKHPDAGISLIGDVNQLDITQILAASHKFAQVVDKPGDKPTRGDSILDKIVTNLSTFYNTPIVSAPIGTSDHRTVLWTPKDHEIRSNSVHIRKVRPLKDSNLREFGRWITSHTWTEVTEAANTGDKTSAFYKTLNSAIQHHFPCRKVKLHVHDKPWITPAIKSLIWVNPSDFVAVANSINEHFASVANDQPPLNVDDLPSFESSDNSAFVVQQHEVYRKLNKIKSGKAGGPDGIPIWKPERSGDYALPCQTVAYATQNADKPGSHSTLVVTDFSKAFDRINHNVLIRKLINLGVRHPVVAWLCSFLTQRAQCVRYKGAISSWITLKGSLPQGTLFGLNGFLVMINSALVDTPSSICVLKYVDDMTIIESAKATQPTTIQDQLNTFADWSNENNMKLNPEKCALLCQSRS
ncbi:uncharacterized protein [Amphiura filiformis]|uniref:uncharacterized protein n=1 Tax=Amphiura filiformis TaxID=82378 RepID=UPI003B21A741